MTRASDSVKLAYRVALLRASARLRHRAQLRLSEGYIFWFDDANRRHTLDIHPYGGCEHLPRIYVGPDQHSEITCHLCELPRVVSWVVDRINAGEHLPRYQWTERAWEANPHKDPKNPSPPGDFLQI